MSQQHPFILYVGGAVQGRVFMDAAIANGGWAYLAEDAAEALGAFIAYTPDATILDPTACPECTAEVYHHLRSVEARPLFILSHDRDWDVSINESDEVYVLNPETPPARLLEIVAAALEPIDLHPAFVY
jgi:hypothetical protein